MGARYRRLAISIISAIVVWNSLSDTQTWSFPALLPVVWVVLAIAALVGVVLDVERHSHRWSLLAWIAIGALLGSAVIGFLEFGLLLVPAIIALMGAAILADRRRGRKSLPFGSAMVTATIVFVFELLLVLTLT